jgi:hypothetical protein
MKNIKTVFKSGKTVTMNNIDNVYIVTLEIPGKKTVIRKYASEDAAKNRYNKYCKNAER